MAKIETLGNSGGVTRGQRMPTGSAPVLADNAQAAALPYKQAAETMGLLQDGMSKLWIADLNKQYSTAKTEAMAFAHKLSLEAEGMPSKNAVDYFSAGMKEYKEEQAGKDYAPYVRNALDEAIDQITVNSGTRVQTSAFRRAIPEQQAVWKARDAEILAQYKRTLNIYEYVKDKSELLTEIGNTSLLATPELRALEQQKFSASMNAEFLNTTMDRFEGLEGSELEFALENFNPILEQMRRDPASGAGINIAELERKIRQLEGRAAREQAGSDAIILNNMSTNAGELVNADQALIQMEQAQSIQHSQGNYDPKANEQLYKDIIQGVTGNQTFKSVKDMQNYTADLVVKANLRFGVTIKAEDIQQEARRLQHNKFVQEVNDARNRVLKATESYTLTPKIAKTEFANAKSSAGFLHGNKGYTDRDLADELFAESIGIYSDGASTSNVHYDQAKSLVAAYKELGIETPALTLAKDRLEAVDKANRGILGTNHHQNAVTIVASILNGNSARTTQFSPELEKALSLVIKDYKPEKKWDIYIGLHGSGYFVEDVRQGLEHLVKNGNIPSAVSYLNRMHRANGSIDQFHRRGDGKPTQVQWLAKNVGSLSPELLKALPNNPEELQRVIDLGEILTGILTNSANYAGKDSSTSKRAENVEYMGILRKAIFEGTGIGTADGKAFSRRDIDAIIGSLSLAVNKTSPDVALATLTGTTTDGTDEIMSAVIEKALKVLSPGELGMSKGGLGYIDRDNVIRSAPEWPAMAFLDAFQKTVEPEEYGGLSGWVSDLGINMASRGQRPFGVVTKPSPILRDLPLEEPHLNNSFAMVQEILPGAILSTENAIITNKVTGEHTMFIPFLDQGGEILGYIGLAADNNGMLSYSNGDGIISTKYRYDSYQTDLQAGEVPIDSEYMAKLGTLAEIKHSSVTYEDDKKPQNTGEEMTYEETIDHYWNHPVVLDYADKNPAVSDEVIAKFIYEYAKEQGWSLIKDDSLSIEDQRVKDFGMDNN